MNTSINGLKVSFNEKSFNSLFSALEEKDLDKAIRICKRDANITYACYKEGIDKNGLTSSFGDLFFDGDLLVLSGSFGLCADRISTIIKREGIKLEKEDLAIYRLFFNDKEAWSQVRHNKGIKALVKAQMSRLLSCTFVALPEELYNF